MGRTGKSLTMRPGDFLFYGDRVLAVHAGQTDTEYTFNTIRFLLENIDNSRIME